nr:hypothetical protein [Tanacetum cinerariifolium]
METTIEQQVVMDEALVPSAQRLRIRRRNFLLLSAIQSKESTLQLVYDVLRRCPFYKAFLVTADVPEIYMQEFWATPNVHQYVIRFKMDNKKHILDLESFRNILHICPRVQCQTFAELPFEEEILDFIWFLGHSATIRTLTDVNINKLYQPWRSFAAVINQCLTGKTSGYDCLRLSQAQILWGLYHKRNINYAFLIWEDFVYQVEHKNHKKSNEMYYPRFTKVIIHHFMSKDLSIPRRNMVNWHYVSDDFMFSTIKLVSRHQSTQQFGAMLPIELTNEEIRNSKAYKEYYAIAIGEATPKPKASARRTKGGSDTSITPPTATATPRPTAAAPLRLTATAKGKQTTKAPKAKSVSALSEPGGSGTYKGTGSKPGVPDVPTDESEEELSWNSSDEQEKVGDDDEGDEGGSKNDDQDDAEGSGDDDEEGGSDEEGGNDEEDDNEETRDDESFDPIPQTPKSSEDEGNGEEDQVLNISEEERLNEKEEADELYRDVDINQGRGMESIFETASTSVASLLVTAPTMTPFTILTTSQSPTLPTPILNDVLQNLPNFASVFRFDDRLRSLEENFFEFRQTNQFAEAVSFILGIVNHYMDQRLNETVKVFVQIQSDRLCEEAQKDNNEFLQTAVNKQLKAEVLTRSSHSSRTSYAVAAGLSEMELKKILIEKIEGNKSIQRSDEQRNLYKALVDAYESDKIILNTYREYVTLKRRRDNDEDKDEEPFAGPDRGSKRRREEEPVQTTSQMEDPSHPEFETGADDQPIIQSSQHPEWFSQPKKPPSSDRDWNKTLPVVHGSIQTWIKLLVGPTYELMKGSCKSLIELEYHLEEVYKDTTDQLDWSIPKFYGFVVNREYARDVYSKRRIITVMELKIVKWHSYKHLDWITVRQDDDKLYKFKEGVFKRLRLQDIKDMLLLLVQGKLTNLTVDEHFAFNVSL